MSTTWACPSCKRRVPLQLLECRCGMGRPARAVGGQPANRAAARQALFSSNADWGWLILFVVLLIGAAVWAARAPSPEALPPLLGVLDRPRPAPSPSPTAPKTARP
jgi:hypothetical protein